MLQYARDIVRCDHTHSTYNKVRGRYSLTGQKCQQPIIGEIEIDIIVLYWSLYKPCFRFVLRIAKNDKKNWLNL